MHQNSMVRRFMLSSSVRLGAVAAALVCTAASLSAQSLLELEASPSPSAQQNRAFLDGREIDFRVTHTRLPGREFKFGPWAIGARTTSPKPNDRMPNLYVVVPGTEFDRSGAEPYSHNRILSLIPKGGGAWQWDVYWALVLGPTLTIDFRSERELLVAAQEEFTPGDDFTLEKAPSYVALRDYLKLRTPAQLDKYRRANGTLPGVLIVPAGFAVRGEAYDVDNTPPDAEKSTAKAHLQR